MNKLKFSLKTLLIVVICWSLAASCSVKKAQTSQKTGDRPNIIVIMSDDHAYQAISAYGSDLIETPYIDKIADGGALMINAFVTNSICSPSRAVLLTGKYSHLNGVKGNRERFDSGQQTFPALLQKHGYMTGIVGKWHLKNDPVGFDYWNILPGQGDYYNPRFKKMGKDTVYNGYVTDVTTDLALEWLDTHKKQEKPFLLMLHQKAPHRNWMPPLEYLDQFNDRDFPFPATFFDEYKDKAALQRQGISIAENLAIDFDSKVPCDTCKVRWKGQWKPRAYRREVGRLTDEQRKLWDKAFRKEYEEFAQIVDKDELVKWQFQRYMEDYLRCVKSVDDNVGRVIKYLTANDLEDNTIIIYTSDQGFYLGEHGIYDKRFMYKESFRTPLMIRYPQRIKSDQRVDNFVLNLDLAPTLLDFAGAEIPEDMQGASMKKLLSGEKVDGWRDKVYYHYYEKNFGMTAHYGIRTSRYKLIHFYDPIDSWELYDLQKDPQEMKNLYKDPQYSETINSLKKDLHELQVKYKDEDVVVWGF